MSKSDRGNFRRKANTFEIEEEDKKAEDTLAGDTSEQSPTTLHAEEDKKAEDTLFEIEEWPTLQEAHGPHGTPGKESLARSKTSIKKLVKQAWAGKEDNVLLSKIGPYKIFFQDIKRTRPNDELESEIDPLLYKIILGIVNDHNHWTLTVMFPSEKRALFLDPFGESATDIQRCQEATRAFMRKKGCNVSRWACSSVPHSRQTDGTSCGVFALKFAECILKERKLLILTTLPRQLRSIGGKWPWPSLKTLVCLL
ncbi:hypothetical protein SKAU_G00280370 [Synaphobranchus kaupii]|uniref:Ubiquitin-like protease family profile domain-containing protein n=1 Tax=Synaphobranchus kaupii TaxID=118154 RepID=A0A9Q1EWZ1_SYNKA|nr:hypothetical protein SKAU_G00280370 [Synaphobranchus kaupii]